MNLRLFSQKLAYSLGNKLYYDQDNVDVLRYGFEVIITGLLKMFILFSLAFLLGILPHVLVIFVTSGVYRLLSGGVHCATYGRCLLFGLVIFLGMGKLAQSLTFTSFVTIIPILACITLISLFISLKWAPAETKNKPLSLQEKSKLKKLTLIWIFIWAILITTCLLIFPLSQISSLVMASMLAHITQALSLTPTGYRVVGFIDKLMGSIFKERREANV
ncbi:accessory gene regulator ArgB-like protein [Desulfitibacter alkalitolerans]|uniref:accessory gene regulator ArgB-like protein n=1 Tax=Desulfitibacter alkalitolerans TaxID=264641 RepID=UPI00068402B1|nr:accessory gene regulator B family protein [Desulfitibacter alkalitolerans]